MSAEREDPQRVAFVGSLVPRADEALYPEISHASAQFQRRLLQVLRAEGFAVDTTISVRQIPPFPRSRRVVVATEHQQSEDGPLHQLPFLNVLPFKPLSLAIGGFLALTRWSRKHRGARRVMLLYNLYPVPAIVCLAAARLTGARVVGMIADLHVPGSGMRSGFLHRIDFALQTWAMPRLDALVVLASRIAADYAPRSSSLLMEGGVDDWSPAAPRVENDIFPILYSGNLAEFRGVPMLLDAFAQLRDPAYRLWITGWGPLEDLVRRAAVADPRITFFGVVERTQLRDLYARAAVLVNPLRTSFASARYQFSSKVLEYLAAGRAVISTTHPDLAGEYAQHLFMLEDETPHALAAVIERVRALPADERERIGERGRAFVLRNKSWKRQGERLAAFLREVLR